MSSSMPRPMDERLVEDVLAGQKLALARAISQVENDTEVGQAILRRLFTHTGNAHVIGVTGAPGTGKSTLVSALAGSYRRMGLSVGVVAVDPTSPFTGGALLGDRVRMGRLSGDEGIFIRSMATRGSLGGLAKTTADVVAVLDAAGFDRVIVETVGVGQAEVEIASTAHTTIVVEAPGLGDDVQAIKAGILEIADIFVVNKADRDGAQRAIAALEMMLNQGGGHPRQIRHHGQLLSVQSPPELVEREDRWGVQVLKTVATSEIGSEELRQRIEAHRDWLLSSGEMAVRERLRAVHTLENVIRAELNRRILAALPDADVGRLVQAVCSRMLDPYSAAGQLLAAARGH
jgi:LAO/AO transport system kinase